MKLMSEEQLTDIGFRQAVIAEILGAENQARKDEARRRYEVYKDKTSKWVMLSLQKDNLKPETLRQMEARVANISICRKIVNKLARTYSGGVQRSVTDDQNGTTAVQEMARFLHFDDKMKKADRYRELQRNSLIGFLPERSGGTTEEPTTRLGMRVFGPWEYDVIEDCFNREIPRVVILSDYVAEGEQVTNTTPEAAAYHQGGVSTSDGRDQVIADAPIDRNGGRRRTFIWWSDNFHFTTYEDGEYCGAMIRKTKPEDGSEPALDISNPIAMLPFVNNAEEQDGNFWAEGGEDVVDGSILVNKTMTDMLFIAYMQGYGIPVITGKNLRDSYEVGPNNALLFDYDPEKDEPKPEVYFASASPQLEIWMKIIEQYVAMLLTTNNLSVKQISGNLTPAELPSGIAGIIEQAEVTLETEDKFAQYADQERQAFRIIEAWQEDIAAGVDCDPAFKALPDIPDNVGLQLVSKFNPVKPIHTEAEKLADLKARKDLGISRMVDLIMIDNPEMTEDQAKAKLLEIAAENVQRMSSLMGAGGGAPQPGQQAPATTETETETETEVEDDLEDEPNAE